jgi:hypothetical protein
VFSSFCYVVLGRLLQLAALRFRSEEFKELEIVCSGTSWRCFAVRLAGPS